MTWKFRYIVILFTIMCTRLSVAAHDIYFCGEKIPLDDDFVKNKLMMTIKRQISYINVASIKANVQKYMPYVEKYLSDANIPQDFKYLAIVESGFNVDISSPVGARGFWQLMKPTAREWGLVINDLVDERTDFDKSTVAACREIARNYLYIHNRFKISSWVLTAAAYNVGIGRIKSAIEKQETNNYFQMNLNPETAAYVYKIIAVKELFEFPELYMNNFGYNIFNTISSQKQVGSTGIGVLTLGSMKVNVNEGDGAHPQDLSRGKIKKVVDHGREEISYVYAKIKGKYKNLEPGKGTSVNFTLETALQVKNNYTAAGQVIQGTAWVIDGRAMIDLGYGHAVVVLDEKSEKGIPLNQLKNKETVILKVIQ